MPNPTEPPSGGTTTLPPTETTPPPTIPPDPPATYWDSRQTDGGDIWCGDEFDPYICGYYEVITHCEFYESDDSPTGNCWNEVIYYYNNGDIVIEYPDGSSEIWNYDHFECDEAGMWCWNVYWVCPSDAESPEDCWWDTGPNYPGPNNPFHPDNLPYPGGFDEEDFEDDWFFTYPDETPGYAVEVWDGDFYRTYEYYLNSEGVWVFDDWYYSP
ncbi:MAG: hypothetical protein NC819_03750 [Candidatus Omnitrophica bacterium]|nr:hypothetical protein [Candidatus Omnitrophota bacterium]